MLIALTKDFAGRKAGRVEEMPDGVAKVLVRKGYAVVTSKLPERKLAPMAAPAKKNVKK